MEQKNIIKKAQHKKTSYLTRNFFSQIFQFSSLVHFHYIEISTNLIEIPQTLWESVCEWFKIVI